jgi:Flp pilus assembly protein TadG
MLSMKLKLAGAAIALTAVIAPVAHAQGGTDPNAKATFRSELVRVDGSTAVLKVTYQCSHGTTLWISAKQLANGKRSAKLAKEGSSKVAKTWLQSHRNPITCDGTSQTGVFTLDKVEPGSKGRLKAKGRHNPGKAYIQFCVTQAPADPSQEGELVLSKSGWVSVR